MTTWLDHPASDATDPQDGGEPIKYWWKDMRPAEVCELVKRVYERGRQSQTSALLDCYERAEDAEDQLQNSEHRPRTQPRRAFGNRREQRGRLQPIAFRG